MRKIVSDHNISLSVLYVGNTVQRLDDPVTVPLSSEITRHYDIFLPIMMYARQNHPHNGQVRRHLGFSPAIFEGIEAFSGVKLDTITNVTQSAT